MNYKQRVFDALTGDKLLSLAQIVIATNLDDDCIRGALSRLRDDRALTTVYRNGCWLYGLRASAERPKDKRGRRKTDNAA